MLILPDAVGLGNLLGSLASFALGGTCQYGGLARRLGELAELVIGFALWGTCQVGWRAPRSGWVLQKISENTRGLLWLVLLAFVATRLSAIFSAPTRSPVACKLGWLAFQYRIPNTEYRKPVVRSLVVLL